MTHREIPSPELLAPAGDFAAACAALQYGADAVYTGLGRFSARAEAVNVTPDDLRRMVVLAHGRTPPARVYVALNTLVQEHELSAAAEAIETVDDAGADAIIVQDLGVARLAREAFPRLRLHASTQLAVHSPAGALALAELGFRRVVPARELSPAEAAHLGRTAGIEVEVFIHGALCYAYSGLCLFSSHQSGHSGNRGRCAYCCREPFARLGADGRRGAVGHPFSMRDLALSPLVGELTRAGIAGLKIEGRMKNALYVAAVTDFYRRKLDGRLSPDEETGLIQDLQTIFSRPWTQLYASSRETPAGTIIDPTAVGHRGALIGAVSAVRRDRDGGCWLGFHSARALEKHDGLQIETPSGGRPYGFAVDRLRRAGGNRAEFALPGGLDIEVRLPASDVPDLPVGAPVFCSASQAVRRRYTLTTPRATRMRPARPVRVVVDLRTDGFTMQARTDEAAPLSATVETPGTLAPARQSAETPAAIRRALDRAGEAPWRVCALEVRDPHGLYAPPSALNVARRDLFAQLSADHEARRAARRAEVCRRLTDTGKAARREAEGAWLRTAKVNLDGDVCPWLADAEEVILDVMHLPLTVLRERLDAWLAVLPRSRVRLALPMISRAWPPTGRDAAATDTDEEAALRATVAGLVAEGWTRWECAGLAGAWLLRRQAGGAPLDLTADWPCYGLNHLARGQLAEWGIRRSVASPEDSETNLAALVGAEGPAVEALVWQQTPLFISETAPVTPGAAPDEAATIFVNRRGGRVMTYRRDARWVTVAQSPFCLAGHMEDLRRRGVRYARADFSWSPPGAVAVREVWEALRDGRTPAGTHTANFRRVLV